MHYCNTKKWLFRIRDAKHRVEMLERRISLGGSDGLQKQLAEAEQELKDVTSEVMDKISLLPDVNRQMVMAKRYVDLLPWEAIASDMSMSVRTVQKIHGRALPLMEEISKEAAE